MVEIDDNNSIVSDKISGMLFKLSMAADDVQTDLRILDGRCRRLLLPKPSAGEENGMDTANNCWEGDNAELLDGVSKMSMRLASVSENPVTDSVSVAVACHDMLNWLTALLTTLESVSLQLDECCSRIARRCDDVSCCPTNVVENIQFARIDVLDLVLRTKKAMQTAKAFCDCYAGVVSASAVNKRKKDIAKIGLRSEECKRKRMRRSGGKLAKS
jgi:hypothetical protein